MRLPGMIACVLVAGCSGVSTVPLSSAKIETYRDGGVAYVLPKGIVPIEVFADAKGIGLTIEPPAFISDSRTGTLVAQLRPSASNNENFKLVADPATGFLTSVSSDSEARILEIVAEIAKTAGRLAFESGKATALSEKVVIMQDSFDPLSSLDVGRINESINAAVRKAEAAFTASGRKTRFASRAGVTLSVHHPDGSASEETGPVNLDGCRIGICTRAITSRVIRVAVDGNAVLSKTISLPSSEVIPVPVPQVIFADQKITITIENGILKQYDMDRDSELLGFVKIPGSAIGGFVAGVTQQFADRKTLADKNKEAVEAEKALADTKKGVTKAALENATVDGKNVAYTSKVQTIYLHSETLAEAIRALKEAPPKRASPGPTRPDGDLIPKPPG